MENDMTTMTAGPLVAHPMTSYKDVTLQTCPLSLFPCHHVNLKYNHHILCVQSITSY